MVKIFINNLPINVPINTSILEACEKIGIVIPRFCYHENLNVAGNCRMCLIEIENAPKPIAACAYPVMNQMRIFTNSVLVKKARENVLEFLLIHHPLDCPICDQGGECDLQEQTLLFGTNKSRFSFFKNSVEDINCSILIKLIMTRCIQCTRCVRFFEKVTGTGKIGILGRGGGGEISLFTKTTLNSEISGNIIDLCPVGALTSKKYAFMFRPWETQFSETIDHTDSLGTKIKVNFKGQEVFRVLPLKTSSNEQWITDKTRFFLDGIKWNRLLDPFQVYKKNFYKIKWNRVLVLINHIFIKLKNKNKLNKIIIVSSNLSLEALELIKHLSYFFNIPIIRENLIGSKTNKIYNFRNDICLKDLKHINLLILIGLNPRIESNLYNLKIRENFFLNSNFLIGSFGVQEDLMYSFLSLGNSYFSLIKVLEGKHFFCKKIVSVQIPFLLVGSSLLNRMDNPFIQNKFYYFTSFIRLKEKNLNTFGLMNSSFNDFGNLSMFYNEKFDSKKITNAFFFETNTSLDEFHKKIPNIRTGVLQSYIQPKDNNKTIQLYFPSSSYLEKESSYFNFLGLVQKTQKIFSFSSTVPSIENFLQIILLLGKKRFKTNTYYSHCGINDFSKILVSNEFMFKTFKTRVFKSLLQKKFENFYQTDLLTKNSLTLNRCGSEIRSFYNTFI